MLVLEIPGELDLILERSRRLGVLPNLDVRVRLSTPGSDPSQESAGDQSVFGLNASQVIQVVDQLRESSHPACQKLLNYHQGSQIPNIAAIREGATEAVPMDCDLVNEGASPPAPRTQDRRALLRRRALGKRKARLPPTESKATPWPTFSATSDSTPRSPSRNSATSPKNRLRRPHLAQGAPRDPRHLPPRPCGLHLFRELSRQRGKFENRPGPLVHRGGWGSRFQPVLVTSSAVAAEFQKILNIALRCVVCDDH